MGEVYRAEDTKLGRQVAIKMLPDAFARDPERLARFEREAKLLASLNHPNIAAIHGLEEADGKRFLVLELVEGQTLAERLHKGPLPLDDTLDVCRQIAEGLEAAHEKGVMHRDLKPANVKITPDGKVKILDFGLAKALADEPSVADSSQSPTISEAMTRPGMILGTAAYMSPEQARGKPLDKRTDIWAFGCVLYECLTGRRVFEGDTITETLAAILKGEPDWAALPLETPPGIRRLLRRCLARESDHRLGDIHDAWIEIQESGAAAESEPAVGRRRQLLWRWFVPLAVGTILGFAVFYALRYGIDRQPPAEMSSLVKFGNPVVLADKRFAMLAISPDGSKWAHVSERAGKSQIFLRARDRLDAVPLDGTENAIGPFFSPDGQWIGFFADGKMKRISVSGSAAIEICKAVDGLSGSWGEDDTIVFVPRWASGLQSVSAAGGTPKSVTTLDAARGEVSHLWPQILPGGKAILFSIITGDITSADDGQIAVQTIGQTEHRILFRGGSYARYVASGHLVYARKGTLLAVPFGLSSLQSGGEAPSLVLNDVLTEYTTGTGHFAVSATGTLAYISGGAIKPDRSIVLVDRHGAQQPLLPERDFYEQPACGRDGTVAVRIAAANDDIWLIHPPRPGKSRFTFAGGNNSDPIWMPEGNRIIFSWDRSGGAQNLFWKTTNGGEQPEPLLTAANDQYAESVSPDGKFLLFRENHPITGWDIWLLPLTGERKSTPWSVTPFGELGSKFSPNGRWITFTSNESGSNEVYLRSFQGTAGHQKISTGGGMFAVWSHIGTELFYINANSLMRVKVDPESGSFVLPERLFEVRNLVPIPRPFFDITRDDKNFVMIVQDEQQAARELRIVLSWFEELKRLVPSNK